MKWVGVELDSVPFPFYFDAIGLDWYLFIGSKMVLRTIIAIAVFHSFACAQEPKLDRLRDTEFEIAKIRSEIGELGEHPWAGEFAISGGTDTGVVLFIAPKSGIAYQEYGNAGVSDANYGVFTVDESSIRIAWKIKPKSEIAALFPSVEDDLVIVPWSDAVFLIPRCSIHRFCITAREQPRYATIGNLVRDRNRSEKLTGKPTLSEDLKIFLDLPEIKATVTDLEKPILVRYDKSITIIKQTVMLDVGADDHVFPGMKFQCEGKGQRPMRITEIRKNSSTASSYDSVGFSSPIRVGSKVKTATR